MDEGIGEDQSVVVLRVVLLRDRLAHVPVDVVQPGVLRICKVRVTVEAPKVEHEEVAIDEDIGFQVLIHHEHHVGLSSLFREDNFQASIPQHWETYQRIDETSCLHLSEDVVIDGCGYDSKGQQARREPEDHVLQVHSTERVR